jgi:hypothetical protein
VERGEATDTEVKTMPKFKVKLELAKSIIVEASNEDEAGNKAFEEVYSDVDAIDLVIADVQEL